MRLADGEVVVGVVVRWPGLPGELAQRVRPAAATVTGTRPVTVSIEDLATDGTTAGRITPAPGRTP